MLGGGVLLVDDDVRVRRALVRASGNTTSWFEAASVEAARSLIEDSAIQISGAIIDVELPDGCGTDLVERLQRRDRAVPIVLISGRSAPAPTHVAFELDVAFLLKPFPPSALKEFFRRVERARHPGDRRSDAALEFARLHSLTRSQTRLRLHLLQPISRLQVATALDISKNTLKDRVSDLLERVACRDMKEVAFQIDALSTARTR